MVFSKPFLGNVIRLNLKNHSDTVFLFKKKNLRLDHLFSLFPEWIVPILGLGRIWSMLREMPTPTILEII